MRLVLPTEMKNNSNLFRGIAEPFLLDFRPVINFSQMTERFIYRKQRSPYGALRTHTQWHTAVGK